MAEAVSRAEQAGDPSVAIQVRLLTTPPTPAEIIADAEAKVFSD